MNYYVLPFELKYMTSQYHYIIYLNTNVLEY